MYNPIRSSQLTFRLFNRTLLSQGATVVASAIVLIAASLLVGAADVSSLLAKLADRTGGAFNIVVACISIPILGILCVLLLRGRICLALGVFVIALNATGRAADLIGVTAYVFEGGFEQRVSLTTALIGVMALVASSARSTPSIRSSPKRRFELLFLVFASLTTVSQFLNHVPWSAAWLSIGGVWQYVALLLIVNRAIRNLKDVRFILTCIAAALVVSALIRLGVRGESFLSFRETGVPERLGSVTFGSYVYYAGTVAFVMISTLWLLRTSRNIRSAVMWSLVLCFLGTELLVTVTQGGYLAILTAVFGVLWKKERKLFLGVMGCAVALFLGAWQWVGAVVTSRGLALNETFFEQQDVATRLWLDKQGVRHFFDRYGFGYGIGQPLYFSNSLYYSGRSLPVHGMILETSEMAGALATLALLLCFFYVGVTLWRISRSESPFASCSLYLLLALSAWFIFANTTGVGILCYAPYEGTILMYLVLFIGNRLAEFEVTRRSVVGGTTRSVGAFEWEQPRDSRRKSGVAAGRVARGDHARSVRYQ